MKKKIIARYIFITILLLSGIIVFANQKSIGISKQQPVKKQKATISKEMNSFFPFVGFN